MQTGYQSVARLSYHCFLTEQIQLPRQNQHRSEQKNSAASNRYFNYALQCMCYFFKPQRVELFTEMKEKQSAQVNLSHTEAG